MAEFSISNYYRTIQGRIIQDIEVLEASDLDGTDTEHWVTYYMEKYGLLPIQLKPEAPVLDEKVNRFTRGDSPDIKRTVERSTALIGLPVEPNVNIKELMTARGDSWIHVAYELKYQDGCIFIESSPSPEAVKQAIDHAKKNIESINAAIEAGNRHLPELIRQQIERRKEAVGARARTFTDLAVAVGAQLKLNSAAERRLSQVPEVKKSIAELRKPRAESKQVPRLAPRTFGTILEVIEGLALTFERTPQTVSKLGEEDIRNLILATLNGTLNLGALGEAFSKQGKTDIYMVVPEGGIFIAECKIWEGQHVIGEALDQILGYLTWRDAYGVVLLFSRNKGFSGVLDVVPTAIKATPSLRGDVSQVDKHHWSARHVLAGDEQQTVEIHYMVYNVCAEA